MQFVLWWDEQEKNPGGNPSQTTDGLLPSKIKTAEDYGLDRDTIHRWRCDMEHMLNYLIEHGQVWILEQRELYRPGAIPLNQHLRSSFDPFFGGDILDSARFKVVPVIENPGFYSEMEEAGQSIPLDFTVMAGITFEDTVLLSERYLGEGELSPGLLFHELVHVVQYRRIGVAEFVTRYIRGWAENGYDYHAIPLEGDAYQLQARYERNPEQPFSVQEEVTRRLRGRLEGR